MARRRPLTPDQIVRKLREAEELLNEALGVARSPGIWTYPNRPITAGGWTDQRGPVTVPCSMTAAITIHQHTSRSSANSGTGPALSPT
jgi:hypothetical protein